MSGLSLGEFSKRYLNIMSDIMRKAIRSQDDAFIRGRLSLPQFLVLYSVNRHGPQKMSFLAKDIAVSLPAMSALTNRLYRQGLIRRVYDQKDRRVIKIDLTSRGKGLIQGIIQKRYKMISNIFSTIKPEEREAFLKILIKIHNFYKS